LLLLLGSALDLLHASAQTAAGTHKAAPQQTVTVVVVNAHAQPVQPVPTVRVSLSYVDGATRVTDSREVTNRGGEAYLQVSSDAGQRGDLRIEVSGVTDLAIYQPADGQLNGLPARITINLLPKGSPALLGPAQIEAVLHRALLQVNSLQRQNRQLQGALAQTQKPDLTASLTEWALSNGFPTSDVDKQVQHWAQEIQKRAAQATLQQKALAEVALKNYGGAAQLFAKAADADDAALEADEQRFLEERRNKLRQLMKDAEQSAGAFQLNLQSHQATVALESVRARAAAEQKKYPEDKALHEIYLEAVMNVANARWVEGDVASGSDSLRLLAQSVTDLQDAGREYLALDDRIDWATSQMNLGTALDDEGLRSGGDQSMALLAQAVQAYQSALQVFTRADYPRDWARTQMNLANTTENLAEQATGDKVSSLFASAVQAYRSALQVNTRAESPQDWATLQMNLGVALLNQGRRASGADAVALFSQAVQAYRSALEVYTKADLPQDWARTQMDLGNALSSEAERTTGAQSTALFGEAVQAYQNALQVFTQAALPQNWATAQMNLGSVLTDQGERTTGDQAKALLAQAVAAFQNSLQVRTKADLPQAWATTQMNLGNALSDEGERSNGAVAAAFFDQAVQAYRNALQVFTQTDLPQDWAVTQMNLGTALWGESGRVTDDKAAPLLVQAVAAFQNALKVYTKASLPQNWAQTQSNLGIALDSEGQLAKGELAKTLFAQAVQAYRSALEVRTKADLPQSWANTQMNLGTVLWNQGIRSTGDEAKTLLAQSVEAYQNALQVYTKADLPDQWARTEMDLGEAHIAQHNYAAAEQDLESSLTVRPDSTKVLADLGGVDLDALFRFDRALEIDTHLVQLAPTPVNRVYLSEANLTTAHFEPCVQQTAQIPDAQMKPPGLMIRDTVTLACQFAAGQKSAALATENSLATRSPSLIRIGWTFAGPLHYIAGSPAFSMGRAAWVALFTAVQNGDAPAMTAALHQLEPLLQP
jgi:tetratricopeptide (TPR) repeat protein